MLSPLISPLLILVLYVCLGLNAAMAEKAPSFIATSPALNEEVIKVDGGPERASSFLGDNFIVVTLYKPDGPGPFPLAIFNHGANGDTVAPGAQPRARQNFLVYYFLSRGYAVALPMMRGYSGSTGGVQTQQSLNLRQFNDNCNYTNAGLDSAKDIKTVIDYLATQTAIDTKDLVKNNFP